MLLRFSGYTQWNSMSFFCFECAQTFLAMLRIIYEMPTRSPRRLSVQQYSGGNAAQNHSTAAVDVFALNIHGLGWEGHLVNFGRKWLVVSKRFKPAERIWDSDWERSSRICVERRSISNSCLIFSHSPVTKVYHGLPFVDEWIGWSATIVGTARTWDVDPKRASSLKDMTNYVVSPLSLGLNTCI